MSDFDNPANQTPSGEGLTKSILYSFITQVVPVVIALLVIPRLITGLGDDRFGLLTLVWVFLGYFTLFDLGLGRATTKFVAEYVAREKHDELPELIWTSWLLLGLLGVVAACIVLLIMPVLTESVLNIPARLLRESQRAFMLVALSVPIVIITTGIRAVLEAFQRFRTIATVTVPASLLTYLIPFFALFFTTRLEVIIGLLWLNRLLFMLLYLYVCMRAVPSLISLPRIDFKLLKPLIQFGGWLTVTNIIGPLMTYLDRFLVGSILSIAEVTYYVTPYEMVRRLKVIPSSIMTVLFPTFSGLNATDTVKSSQLFHLATRILFLIACPVMISIVVLSEDLLTLWIDEAFAQKSAPVLQWLAIGILINFLGQVAYNWVQSVGRSDLTAKLHLLELPFYLALIWILARSLGIVGVAIAWTSRVAVDAVSLFWLARKSLNPNNNDYDYLPALGILGLCFFLASTILVAAASGALYRFAAITAVILVYAFVSWRWFLTAEERVQLLSRVPWFEKFVVRAEGPG